MRAEQIFKTRGYHAAGDWTAHEQLANLLGQQLTLLAVPLKFRFHSCRIRVVQLGLSVAGAGQLQIGFRQSLLRFEIEIAQAQERAAALDRLSLMHEHFYYGPGHFGADHGALHGFENEARLHGVRKVWNAEHGDENDGYDYDARLDRGMFQRVALRRVYGSHKFSKLDDPRLEDQKRHHNRRKECPLRAIVAEHVTRQSCHCVQKQVAVDTGKNRVGYEKPAQSRTHVGDFHAEPEDVCLQPA